MRLRSRKKQTDMIPAIVAQPKCVKRQRGNSKMAAAGACEAGVACELGAG
jgi:hypothetical protein